MPAGEFKISYLMPKSNNSDNLHQSTSYQVKIISKIYLFCTFWASKILPIFVPVQTILPMVYRYTGGTVNFQNEQPYQRANNEKGEFSQLQKWMRQRGFSTFGIQTGPFAAL